MCVCVCVCVCGGGGGGGGGGQNFSENLINAGFSLPTSGCF